MLVLQFELLDMITDTLQYLTAFIKRVLT